MIRILCVNLSTADDSIYHRLYGQASPERKARADRYRRREDALRCVAADALLRYVLKEDYDRVAKTQDGKPFLPDRRDFHFNLSHSGNWVAIAFGTGEVGLDVEDHHGNTRIEAIARRFFAPEEQRYVFQENDRQDQRFFQIWTGKESYLKYLGTGLKQNLTAFSVLSLEPEIQLHQMTLPDGSWISLCTTEKDYMLDLLELQHL